MTASDSTTTSESAASVTATASPAASLRRQARTAVLWSAAEKWLTRLGSLAAFVVLARLLAPGDFGVLASAGTVTGLAGMLVEAGLGKYLIQVQRITTTVLSTVFWLCMAFAAVSVLAMVVAAPWLAALFDAADLVPVLRILAIFVLVNTVGLVPAALLQRELKFRPLAVRRMCATALSIVVSVTLAFAGAGVWALVAQSAVASLASTVILLVYSRFLPRFEFSRAEAREAVRFGGSMLGIETLGQVGRYSDNILVGAVLGPVALGFYAVGYRVLIILLEVLTSVTATVAMPLFAKIRDDPERLRRGFVSAVRLGSVVAFPAFAGLAAVAPVFVPVAFGEGWAPSVAVMQWLALAGLVQCVTYFDRPLLLAVGRASLELKVMLLSTLGTVVAFAVAVPFGIAAVAAAYALTNVLTWPIRLWALSAVGIPLRRYIGAIAAPGLASAAAAGAAAAVVYATNWSPVLRLVVAVLAAAPVYVGVLAVAAPDTIRQIRRFLAR